MKLRCRTTNKLMVLKHAKNMSRMRLSGPSWLALYENGVPQQKTRVERVASLTAVSTRLVFMAKKGEWPLLYVLASLAE